MKRLVLLIAAMMLSLCMIHAESDDMLRAEGHKVKVLDSIAVSFYEKDEYDQAEKYFLEELQLLKDSLKTDIDSTCSKVYTYLSGIYTNTGEYYQAAEAILTALDIKAQVYGSHHPEYAISMSVYGDIYIAMGDDAHAEPYLKYALQIYSDSLGVNNSVCLVLLQELGLVYVSMGDYLAAEQKLLQAIQICKELEGETSDKYATLLHTLGLLYHRTGDYDGALSYLVQAYNIWSEINTHSKEVAISCSSIGRLCTEIGEYDLADQFLSAAVYLQDSIYHGQSLEYARTLSNAAYYFKKKADYPSALDYYLAAKDIRQSLLGQHNLEYAHSLNDVGAVLFVIGEYDLAEEYYVSAYRLFKELSSTYDDARLTAQLNLAHLYYVKGQYAIADVYSHELYSLYKTQYVQSVDFLSARQRQEYWNTMSYYFEYLHPNLIFRYQSSHPLNTISAYDSELFKKGLLLTSSDAVKHSVMESGDTTLIHQWTELTAKKQQIMRLEEKDPTSKYVEQLREETETLEKEITRSSAAYRENLRQWSITWDSVRAALKPNQVAIEFMRAPLNEDSTMYCALLVQQGYKHPELIPLFEQKQVAKLLYTSTGDSVKINNTYLFNRNGKELSHLIWNRIKPYLREGEQIFFAPTHMLHQIAIEHLPYDATRTMSDVYQITRLSSTRELVLRHKQIPHKQASLYGGILFDALSADIMAYNKEQFAARAMTAADSKDAQRRLTNIYAPPLYGTQAEVDAIAPILKSKHCAVTIYSHYSACEESVKALSGKKQNILHFATHGMYVDTLTVNDPLERCLLTFAGANRALRGDTVPEGIEDGILTAKEISVLDFRDADIVVMSACETALGDVSGEGVFGLQRAFKMAGAQTILMALWRVDDKATQMLMTAFYRYYSGYHKPKREAFRLAQEEVRNYTKKKTVRVEVMPTQEELMRNQGKILEPRCEYKTILTKPYESPYYWAGFILLD